MSGTGRDVAMLLTVTSGALLQFAGTVSTELLFTAVITGGFVLLLHADSAPARRWKWALAGLVLGLAYHVRYAGLFLVAGLGPVLAWHLVVSRDRTRMIGVFIAGCSATAVVGLGFARNILLVGNWRGGNEKVVSHPLSGVASESVRAAHGLILGPGWGGIGQSLAIRAAFFGLLAVGAIWLLARRRTPDPATARPDSSRLVPIAIVVAVYVAGMVYAALTSVISYGTRMFVPLIPVLALLTVGAVHSIAWGRIDTASRPRFARAVSALLLTYVVLNGTALWRPPVDRESVVRAQLEAVDDSGRSVRDVLSEVLGSNGVLLANNGQAVGYVLDRPTVSLVGPRYSVQEWDEDGVQDVVRRFGVRAVLITSPNAAQPDEPDLIPSAFVRGLADGDAPAWLRPLGRVGVMTIYVPAIRQPGP